MDANFWYQRWKANQIGFHEANANALMVSYFKELSLSKDGRVFVPLCGKTLDIGWLLSNGYGVAGVELSELAVKQLFAELGTEPEITGMSELKHYGATNIDIFVGDIFVLTGKILGAADVVYDRAALVALPEDMRFHYSKHLADITAKAPQLLITFEYDQKLMQGPPFSISDDEIQRHYKGSYEISLLASVDVPGGLKGICAAKEKAWLLKPL